MHTQHFFLRQPILLKQGGDFSHVITLQFVADVVQHSILLSLLLGDRALSVACHMRSWLARIVTEQLATGKSFNSSAHRKKSSWKLDCFKRWHKNLALTLLCSSP
jgi:hypothetical protein